MILKLDWFICSLLLTAGVYTQDITVHVINQAKGGTHLLRKCFGLMTERLRLQDPSARIRVRTGHPFLNLGVPPACRLNVYGGAEKKSYYMIIKRDPRDSLISWMYWIDKNFHENNVAYVAPIQSPNALKYMGNLKEKWISLTQVEKMEVLLEGQWPAPFNWYSQDTKMMSFFLRNLKKPLDAFVCDFETLVGKEGNARVSDEIQIDLIRRMAKHCEIPLAEDDLKYVRDELFGGSYTFRKGQVGQWKDYFNEHLENVYEKNYAPYDVEMRWDDGGGD